MTKNKGLKIAYFGTPRFSTFVLNALLESKYAPTLVVTAPDRPAGRGLIVTAPPVKAWAKERDIPVIQPESLTKPGPELDVLLNSEWDLFVVAAYGKILPKSVLDIPAHGALNVHPSLLPSFRGMSPIETQILEDEKTVGVSILVMDELIDHGPVLAQASITPNPWPMRTHELEDILWSEGGALLTEVIPGYLDGSLKATPQEHTLATLTKRMSKEDGLLDLAADGYQNYLKFCAYDEWPGTFFFENGKRIKIVEAELKNGQFIPLRVTPEGKKEQAYRE